MAHLSQIAWVPKGHLKRDGKLVRRLSTSATAVLQTHLARMHGRQLTFSPSDKVPHSGDYLCCGCFIRQQIVTKKAFAANDSFSPCDVCGELSVWLKPDA